MSNKIYPDEVNDYIVTVRNSNKNKIQFKTYKLFCDHLKKIGSKHDINFTASLIYSCERRSETIQTEGNEYILLHDQYLGEIFYKLNKFFEFEIDINALKYFFYLIASERLLALGEKCHSKIFGALAIRWFNKASAVKKISESVSARTLVQEYFIMYHEFTHLIIDQKKLDPERDKIYIQKCMCELASSQRYYQKMYTYMETNPHLYEKIICDCHASVFIINYFLKAGYSIFEIFMTIYLAILFQYTIQTIDYIVETIYIKKHSAFWPAFSLQGRQIFFGRTKSFLSWVHNCGIDIREFEFQSKHLCIDFDQKIYKPILAIGKNLSDSDVALPEADWGTIPYESAALTVPSLNTSAGVRLSSAACFSLQLE